MRRDDPYQPPSQSGETVASTVTHRDGDWDLSHEHDVTDWPETPVNIRRNPMCNHQGFISRDQYTKGSTPSDSLIRTRYHCISCLVLIPVVVFQNLRLSLFHHLDGVRVLGQLIAPAFETCSVAIAINRHTIITLAPTEGIFRLLTPVDDAC